MVIYTFSVAKGLNKDEVYYRKGEVCWLKSDIMFWVGWPKSDTQYGMSIGG